MSIPVWKQNAEQKEIKSSKNVFLLVLNAERLDGQQLCTTYFTLALQKK